MAKFTANHDKLYFDTLCRTKKAESVLSLIQATYQVKGKGTDNAKDEIAKKLEYAYELFKGDSGTYNGDPKQFESQYTIGHELCIWKNGNLDLTDLAIEVAENRITIRDYFDIVFLNYIQPVNNVIVHILYHLLTYMKENGLSRISKEEMIKAYKRICHIADDSPINGTYNMLLASNYFKADDTGKSLIYCGLCSIDELISRCDTTYVEKGYEVAKEELKKEEDYIKYLQHDYRFKKADGEESADDAVCVKGGENRLLYGVPGVGKSHAIKEILKDATGNIERVVFHPDYTYSDFVGQIMPTLIEGEDGNDRMVYRFVPGPFTVALKAAKDRKDKMHYLVIEEINRGNASAIFGEIFQLLDRDDDGRSEYGITNFDISKELYGKQNVKIFIPSNLTILATMNTSDQNVFTLDTAFQRRWNMKHIPNSFDNDHAKDLIGGSKISWGIFATVVNDIVIEINSEFGGSGDKRLGAYFAKVTEMSKNPFSEKVLKYMWDDAFRMDKQAVFASDIKSLEKMLEDYQSSAEDPLKAILKPAVYQKMLDKMSEQEATTEGQEE